jgi:molecular chaperone GrpE
MSEKKIKTDIEKETNKPKDTYLENENIETEDIKASQDINLVEELPENELDPSIEEASAEESLKDEIMQLKDEKLRLLAEMENLRKRTDRDRVDLIKYGSINFARDILSPDDNLTRALSTITEEDKKSETITNLIDGLKMVQKEFSTILEKHGIKKIEALKQKFDHNFHQAMLEIESDDFDEGTVIQEVQSGYTMHERLLRPSMVGVSKKPSTD